MPHSLAVACRRIARPALSRTVVTAAAVVTVAIACAASLSGCSSSGSHPAAKASTATSAATMSTMPAAPSGITLGKAAFIEQADAICTKIDKQLSALPQPTSQQDYPGLAANLAGSMALYRSYIAQVQPLADKTADATELNSKWLTLENEDFARAEPLVTQMLAALKAKNAAAVQVLASRLNALPDRTKQYAAELTSYGITACAKLENDSSGG